MPPATCIGCGVATTTASITGAGGGGYLFLYCEFGRKHVVAEELEKLGAEVVDFSFEPCGLQTWEIRS